MSGAIFKENVAAKFGAAMKLFFDYSKLNEVKENPSGFENNVALTNSTVHTSRPSYYLIEVYNIVRTKDIGFPSDTDSITQWLAHPYNAVVYSKRWRN